MTDYTTTATLLSIQIKTVFALFRHAEKPRIKIIPTRNPLQYA